MPAHPLSRRIAEVLDLQPDAPAVEFDRAWCSWAELGESARRIADLALRYGYGETPQVGILLRNRPVHVAALLGVLLAGGTVVVLNPARGRARTRADLAALELPLLVGTAADLAATGPHPPRCTVVALDALGGAPAVTAAAEPAAVGSAPGVAVRMLTSGTTGPPKRVPLTYRMLAHSVMGPGTLGERRPTAVRRGVAIVNAPLVHIGGVFRVLQCIAEARPFVLLEKFELDTWADAVRRHRPRTVSLVPAALRTVLHSGLTRADLAGIRAVTCGTAPLAAEDAEAFTERFGIPVLTSYAATEFGGGVAGWTLADHRRYWPAKRGSVGRATGGARLRVVDEAGRELGPDRPGLLEVRPGQFGPDAEWLRTTDLARIDADGFLWILGRADQAIIRGGFKVMPEEVRAALERHPAVRGAAVVGRPDRRLGEVPVALVEPHPGAGCDPDELVAFLRERLAPYEVPTAVAVVGSLPRTPSGKPDLTAVRTYFTETVTADG